MFNLLPPGICVHLLPIVEPSIVMLIGLQQNFIGSVVRAGAEELYKYQQ